jgi:hypothetical protein
MGSPKFRHSFTLIDYNRKVDDCLMNIVQDLKNKDIDFNTILRSVPMVSKLNLKELLYLPSQAPTRQITWAEFVARLRALDFLVNISPSHGKLKNNMELNYLNRMILRYQRDSSFNQISDYDLYNGLQTRIKLLQLLTK